jgi:hypothetical protein
MCALVHSTTVLCHTCLSGQRHRAASHAACMPCQWQAVETVTPSDARAPLPCSLQRVVLHQRQHRLHLRLWQPPGRSGVGAGLVPGCGRPPGHMDLSHGAVGGGEVGRQGGQGLCSAGCTLNGALAAVAAAVCLGAPAGRVCVSQVDQCHCQAGRCVMVSGPGPCAC